MRRRLFETENLDLEKAIRMYQAMEATTADMQSLGVKTELGEKVAAIDSTRATPNFATGQSKPKGRSAGPEKKGQVCESGGETDGTNCSCCGRSYPPRRCPAYSQQCKRCLGYSGDHDTIIFLCVKLIHLNLFS